MERRHVKEHGLDVCRHLYKHFTAEEIDKIDEYREKDRWYIPVRTFQVVMEKIKKQKSVEKFSLYHYLERKLPEYKYKWRVDYFVDRTISFFKREKMIMVIKISKRRESYSFEIQAEKNNL